MFSVKPPSVVVWLPLEFMTSSSQAMWSLVRMLNGEAVKCVQASTLQKTLSCLSTLKEHSLAAQQLQHMVKTTQFLVQE